VLKQRKNAFGFAKFSRERGPWMYAGQEQRRFLYHAHRAGGCIEQKGARTQAQAGFCCAGRFFLDRAMNRPTAGHGMIYCQWNSSKVEPG